MNSNRKGSLLRAGMLGAAAILTGVAVYWAALPESSVAPEEPRPPQAGLSIVATAPRTVRAATRDTAPAEAAVPVSEMTPQASDDTEVATVAQYATEKY